MKHIYLYTTPTFKLKNWFKIGQTIKDPKLRVSEQDNASNPEPLILVAYWQIPDHVSDKYIHSKLEEFGFPKLRGNREWFELSDTPEDDVLSAIETITPDIVKKDIIKILPVPVLDYTEMWWFKCT